MDEEVEEINNLWMGCVNDLERKNKLCGAELTPSKMGVRLEDHCISIHG